MNGISQRSPDAVPFAPIVAAPAAFGTGKAAATVEAARFGDVSARAASLHAVRVKGIQQSLPALSQLVERLFLELPHFRGWPRAGLACIGQRLHAVHVARIGGFILMS
jgi:hypothetical protein